MRVPWDAAMNYIKQGKTDGYPLLAFCQPGSSTQPYLDWWYGEHSGIDHVNVLSLDDLVARVARETEAGRTTWVLMDDWNPRQYTQPISDLAAANGWTWTEAAFIGDRGRLLVGRVSPRK